VASDQRQNISTPDYPGYDNRADCTWIIRSVGGARISLVIEEMNIEDSTGCIYDALKVYDG